VGEPRFLLVTGTDTGVGKTVVACGLAAALRGAGRRVQAVKPVESGCDDSAPDGEDGALLATAARQHSPLRALVRLRAPLAPPVAAEREGVALRPADWETELRRLAAGHEVVLVEGAGGLLSPLAWGYDARGLAQALGAAALLVGADRLGTLNHCLLTREALASARVPLLGVVLSAPERADAATGGGAAALARCGVERVAVLPRLADPAAAPAQLGRVVEWVEAWLRAEGWPAAASEPVDPQGVAPS
jgi:dethiobiotin synthetase